MSEPIDHHYLPVFYLKSWRGDDGKICRFNCPRGEAVFTKRVFPKATAYEEHLYSMRSPDGTRNADMEKGFMSRLDTDASRSLALLEKGLRDNEWQPKQRSAWSRFVLSQMLRTPSDIEQFKSCVKEEWSAAISNLQKAYEAERPDGAPESVDDYLASLDAYTEDRFALSIARQSMDHSGVGQLINNMHWRVLNFEGCGIPLLTSDRPVRMSLPLTASDSYILMPIGPTRLFAATRTVETMQRLKSQRRRQQAKNVNKITVQHAVRYVFGVDDKMKPFVQKHFAQRRHPSLMERLANMRGHSLVAQDAPFEDPDIA